MGSTGWIMGSQPRKRGRYALHPRRSTSGAAAGGGTMSAFRSRKRRNGGVQRPQDTFVLRPDIPMPGAYPIAAAVEEVLADWWRQTGSGTLTESTRETHSKVLRTLAKYARSRGARVVCDISNEILNDWMFAPNAYTGEPVADTTPGLRRAVASAFYYTCFNLGITDVNAAATLPSTQHPQRYVCPFTAEQIDALKEASQFAHRGTKSPAALALALLGAAPGEVGSIRCEDVRLVDMLVRAHGGGSRYAERWLPIDDPWCFDQLAARLKQLAAKHPDDWQTRYVAYEPREGKDDSFARRSAATSTTLTKVIEKAGLKRNGVRRVASIGEYVAARVFAQTGRLEAVAARLGIDKLDDAATIVGYDWRSQFAQPAPGNGSGS